MSQLVVIGLGDDGRSRVVDIRDVASGSSSCFPGAQANDLWDTLRETPSVLPRRRCHDGNFRDIKVPPGASRWVMLSLAAHLRTPFHHTPTLDLVVVLRGEVVLGLEEGELTLRAGDHAIIPAAMHSWKTGSLACAISVMHYGVATPLDEKDDLECKRQAMKLEMWEALCRSLLWLA
jgi:quercetin dioxygenase-like cupin family protein